MALSSLTSLQIILVVVLSLNFFIWVAFIFWRILFFDGVGNTSRRYFRGLRALFRMSPSPETSGSNEQSGARNTGVESGEEVDEPPPYEEAVKYPSISSLLTMNTEIGSPLYNDLNLGIRESERQIEMTSTSTSSNFIITSEAVTSRQTTSSVQSSHPLSSRSLSCGHIHSTLQQQPHQQDTNAPKST